MVVRNLIGESARGEPERTYNVLHPGTLAVVHQVERSTKNDIAQAIATAHSGLAAWSAKPLSERKAIISRAASILADESSGWAKRMHEANMAETSCPEWWAGEQGRAVPKFLDALVDCAEEALREETVEVGPGESRVASGYGVSVSKTVCGDYFPCFCRPAIGRRI